ncbi:hypothetical protein Hanom_Chr01g00019551 [Helianthus anomalus]
MPIFQKHLKLNLKKPTKILSEIKQVHPRPTKIKLMKGVIGLYNLEVEIKEELRFMLKLSRMSMMVNLREMMSVQDIVAVRMKNRI